MSFSSPPSAEPNLSAGLSRSVHQHAGLYMVEGGLLVLLGLAAIAIPLLAGLAATLILGWLLIIAGVTGLVFSLRARQAPGFGWALLSALLALVAGIVLLWNPLQGLVTLTYVLIAYFVVDGIFMIGLALSHRRELAGRWEWMALNGLIDLVLAGIVFSGMPGTLAWALGLLVGIDLVFGGVSLIAMARAAQRDNRAPHG